MPLESCSPGIQRDTYGGASGAGSRTNLVSSRSESKALAAYVGGTLGLGCCSAAVRSGRAGGCPAWDLGCSRRMVIVPLPGRVDKKSPCWNILWILLYKSLFSFKIEVSIEDAEIKIRLKRYVGLS
jgi:hypothetical protein